MIASAKPARFGLFASAKSLVQNVWNRGAGSKAPSNIPVSKPGQPGLAKTTEAKKSAVIPGSSGAPPLSSQTKRIPSGGSNTSVQFNAPGRSTLAAPVVSGEGGGTAASGGILKSPAPCFNPPSSSAAANPRSLTVAGYGHSNHRGGSLVGFSSLGTKTGLSANNSHVSSMGARSNVRTSAGNLEKHAAGIPRSRTSSTLMAPTASSLAKTNSHSRIPVSTASRDNSTFIKASANSKQQLAMSPQPSATSEQRTDSPAHPPRPGKIFSQPLSPPPAPPPMSLTTTASRIVGQAAGERPPTSLKPVVPPKPKVLPGRRPRISRSKVIARLASQRAAGAGASTSAGTGTERAGGKVRSSMSAEVAGKTRQSYGGTRGGDPMMSAKKRVRQSEYARRRSRTTGDGQRMDVD